MSAEDRRTGVVPARGYASEDLSFDSLARGLASGSISRRTAIKGLAAAGIAGLFGWGVGLTEAEAGDCDGNFCGGKVRQCKSNKGDDCVCYKKPGGGSVCAADNGICNECVRDRDCPDGFHCVKNGRRCCGGSPKNVCAAPCGSDDQQGALASSGTWTGAAA